MKDDRRTANIDPDILKLVFDRVRYHDVLSWCLPANRVTSFARNARPDGTMTDNLSASNEGLSRICAHT